ncbi:MAG: hypothetical protein KDK39_15185 [Leptospiraceae bacterium]|nr:hypothetical protein [Leptospiraceae bacterium]
MKNLKVRKFQIGAIARQAACIILLRRVGILVRMERDWNWMRVAYSGIKLLTVGKMRVAWSCNSI